MFCMFFLFSIRRRLTICAFVTGVQTCALPIYCPIEARRPLPAWAPFRPVCRTRRPRRRVGADIRNQESVLRNYMKVQQLVIAAGLVAVTTAGVSAQGFY